MYAGRQLDKVECAYSIGPPMLLVEFPPVVRYMPSEIAWHSWEQPVVAARGVAPVVVIVPVSTADTYRRYRGNSTIVPLYLLLLLLKRWISRVIVVVLFAQLDCFGPFALAWAGDVWTFLCQAQEGVERKEGGGGEFGS